MDEFDATLAINLVPGFDDNFIPKLMIAFTLQAFRIIHCIQSKRRVMTGNECQNLRITFAAPSLPHLHFVMALDYKQVGAK